MRLQVEIVLNGVRDVAVDNCAGLAVPASVGFGGVGGVPREEAYMVALAYDDNGDSWQTCLGLVRRVGLGACFLQQWQLIF